MSIWLDDLEREAQEHAEQNLQDRRALRMAMHQALDEVQAGREADSVLIMLDFLPRPHPGDPTALPAAPAQGQALLREELLRQPYQAFELRRGQACVLVPGAPDADSLQRVVMRLNRRLQALSQRRYKLVFGLSRASEARNGGAGWLALADLRLQVSMARAGLAPPLPTGPRPGAFERRRTGKR